jgi:hypothetical protein
VTCGGAFQGDLLWLEFANPIASDESEIPLRASGVEARVSWNPGPYVWIMPATWGHLKALYR